MRSTSKYRLIFLSVKINNVNKDALFDTGSTDSLIDLETCKNLSLKIDDTVKLPIGVAVQSNNFATCGRIQCDLTIGQVSRPFKFYVISNLSTNIIIGLDAIQQFKLTLNSSMTITQDKIRINTTQVTETTTSEPMRINEQLDKDEQKQISLILDRHQKVFSSGKFDVGHLADVECEINLTDNIPINIRPYETSETQRAAINEQIDQLLQSGIISKSNSPYEAPIVMVKKKDEGDKTRMCTDFRRLNKKTVPESYYFPLVNEIMQSTLHCRYFSKVDMSNGYYHIKIAEKDRYKTAFCTESGKYEWNAMPFGLKNAPAIFQRAVHQLLMKHGLTEFASNYLDDIIIFSKTFEDHLDHLKQVLDALEKENVKLKPSKCEFGLSEIEYLGHTLAHNIVKPLLSNADAISQLPRPTNVKQVRQFCGKVNYYRKFIPNVSKILSPINQLTCKNQTFNWTDQCQEAFDNVKRSMSASPVLQLYDPSKTCYLYVDACKYGIGAVLKQASDTEGTLLPVGYFSASLLKYQQNYTTTELECLALVKALQHWRHLLSGKTVEVFTDHESLKEIDRNKDSSSRLFRWSLELSQFSLNIHHIPGETNVEADELSRNPVRVNLLSVDNIKNQIQQENINLASIGDYPQLNSYAIQNNLLLYLGKLFVPQSFREELVNQMHKKFAHMSTDKLYHLMNLDFNWPKMRSFVETIVKRCHVCLGNKSRPPNRHGLFVSSIAQRPFDIVSIDTVGGFDGYNSAKKNLHLAIDHHTRFVWCTFSKTSTTKDIICLINKVLTMGTPRMIKFDNHTSQKSREIRNFLQSKGIDFQYCAPNSPQSMGMVERVNSTLKNTIRCIVNDSDYRCNSWVKAAEMAVDVYNNHAVHSGTGFKPSEMMFNQQLHQQITTPNIERANKYRVAARYNLNDLVFFKNEAIPNRKKLDPEYLGPATVIEHISDSMVRIEFRGRRLERSVTQLKPVIPLDPSQQSED